MRHRKHHHSFGRFSAHRKALFKNLVISLIEHEIIKTTLPKARELRRVFEPLVTLAKVDTVANRRLAFARIRHQEAVKKLFAEFGLRSKDRKGGYLRILKIGSRLTDSAPMAYIEWVDRVNPLRTEE